MSETVSEYMKKKAFEDLIIGKLMEKMEELYTIRNSIKDMLEEVDTEIKVIEKDFLNIIEKIKD